MSSTGQAPRPSHGDELPELTATELRDRLEAPEPLVLLDVREPFEMHIADLPEVGQLRIPLRELPARVGELEAGAEMVLYCRYQTQFFNIINGLNLPKRMFYEARRQETTSLAFPLRSPRSLREHAPGITPND